MTYTHALSVGFVMAGLVSLHLATLTTWIARGRTVKMFYWFGRESRSIDQGERWIVNLICVWCWFNAIGFPLLAWLLWGKP